MKKDGRRHFEENDNVLTVVANESYEEFADSLQSEMENETGIRFGYIEPHIFATITYANEQNEEQELGSEQSQVIYNFFVEKKYIDQKGKIKETLKQDIVQRTIELPEQFKPIQASIEAMIKKSIKKLPIFNQKDKVNIQLNKQVLLSEEFKQLWDKIKHKTTYSVEIDSEQLIKNSVLEIKRLPRFRARKIKRENAYLDITKAGVTGTSQTMRVYEALEERRYLPDILRYLQDKTNLK